jgi:hypothetical protein
MADVDGSRDTDITIYLERIVDRVGDYGYDPASPYAKPSFYAYIVYLPGDVPTEIEVRLSGGLGGHEEMLTITPRQLNEQGDIYVPVSAIETAIDQIRTRTEENKRATSARVGVSLDIEGEAEREEKDGSGSGG